MLKHLGKGSEAQDNPLLRRQHGIAEGALVCFVLIPSLAYHSIYKELARSSLWEEALFFFFFLLLSLFIYFFIQQITVDFFEILVDSQVVVRNHSEVTHTLCLVPHC